MKTSKKHFHASKARLENHTKESKKDSHIKEVKSPHEIQDEPHFAVPPQSVDKQNQAINNAISVGIPEAVARQVIQLHPDNIAAFLLLKN